MNKQNPPNAIEWTRIRNPDGTVRPGYTWNPVAGCHHGCRWQMPDGAVAVCYAETVAERVAQKAYPHGFAHTYWHPERLKEPGNLKEPAGIFVDSMSDLMDSKVESGSIQQVIETMRAHPQHVFQVLTKNAPRLLKFEWPDNAWVGVSTPPDWYMGKRLSAAQRLAFFETGIKALRELRYRGVPVTWFSAEPFPTDMALAPSFGRLNYWPDWCVIGAASDGATLYAPDLEAVQQEVAALEQRNTTIFFKGNMRCLPWAAQNWRDGFPRWESMTT